MAVTFQKRVLGNGLTIVGEIDEEAHTSACGFFVKTGARDEDRAVMGVSHFLEHMMFKGTDRRSADDVNREFDEIGAQYNAYTSAEITCFYASTLPEHFPVATDILADILRPAIRETDFDTEKGVILEEIAMYKDNPFWNIYERAMEEYFEHHTLAHRVLGTEETVSRLRRDQMKEYFDERYSADNTTVALAGRVDFDDACEQIESACHRWTRTGATRDGGTPQTVTKDFTERSEKVSRGYAMIITPAPALQDERRYAAMMLAKVLGDQDNSRLHWSLIETGLADEAVADYDPRDGCGQYIVYVSGEPAKIDELLALAQNEIAGLVDSLTEDDLEKLRSRIATGVVLAGERPGGRMQRLGRLWTYLGEYLTLEQELERINAVTLDEVRSVFEAFPFEPRTVGRLLPA